MALSDASQLLALIPKDISTPQHKEVKYYRPKFYMSRDEEEAWKNYSKKGLSIGVLDLSPYVYSCFDQQTLNTNETIVCSRPGMGIELTLAVCQILQLPCFFKKVNHTMFGDNLNGTWRGMIRQIMDGEFDTSYPAFNPTTERVKVVEFSSAVYDDNPLIIAPVMREPVRANSLLQTFTWQVWFLIMATVVLIGIIFAFSTSNRHKKSPVDVVRPTLDAFTVFTGQDPQSSFHKSSTCIAFTVWALSCTILGGVFTSQVLGQALDSDRKLPFKDIKSFARCVVSRKCYLETISLSTSYMEWIQNADKPPLLDLKKALALNPIRIMKNSSLFKWDFTPAFRKPTSGRVFGQASVATAILEAPSCSLGAVSFTGYRISAFPFAKNNKLITLVNKAITLMREIGIIDRTFQKYVGNTIESEKRCSNEFFTAFPLSVRTVSTTFLMVVIGAIVSIMVVIIELINSIVSDKRKKRLLKDHIV